MRLQTLDFRQVKMNVIALSFFTFFISPVTLFAAQPFALVELYTSEGCSSCPPAEEFLSQITQQAQKDNANIMTLEFHVDYWNYLGWNDDFSDPRFAERQRRYASVWGENNIYTPQMVINGTYGSSGLRRSVVQQNIDQALKASALFDMEIHNYILSERNVSFDVKPSKNVATPSMVNIALVEHGISVDIKSGENRGRTLDHTNVVRYFDSVSLQDDLRKIEFTVLKDVNINKSSIIVYVQQKNNMMITAATQQSLVMEK